MASVVDFIYGDQQKVIDPVRGFKPFGASTPGLDIEASKRGFDFTRSDQLQGNLDSLSNAFGDQAGQFRELRPLVEPGFGRLTETGVNAIRDARRSTLGDLRTNLSRRRVLGSSFAQGDINRTTAEFQKREDEFRAKTFLQEIDAQRTLINDEFNATTAQYKTLIDQSNFETGLAAQLAANATSVLGDIAKFEARLLQEQAGNQAGLFSLAADALLGDGDGISEQVGNAPGGLISKGIGAVGNGIAGLAGAGGFTNLAGQLPFSGGLSNPFSNPFIGGPNKIGSFGGGALANTGAGIGGNILARQAFPNVGSVEGSIGSTIGGIVGGMTPLGPIGAAIGSFIGGAIGGQLAGGNKDNIDATLITGGESAKDFKKGLFAEGAFGKIGLKRSSTRNITGKKQKALQPLFAAIAEMDDTLAAQLSPEEVQAMTQQKLSAGNVRGNAKKMWIKSINRRKTALSSVIPQTDPRFATMQAYLDQQIDMISKKKG